MADTEEDKSSKPRTAYIRTTLNPDSHPSNIHWLITSHVFQPPSSTRHRFLLAAVNSADTAALDALLHASWPPSARDSASTGTYLAAGPERPFLERADLEVWLPTTGARSGAGARLKAQLADAGVCVRVVGNTDEDCDAALLEAADYVLDETALRCSAPQQRREWFMAVREGRREVVEKPLDWSELRLRARYAQHSWAQCSGTRRPRGTTAWRCIECGERCKARGVCKSTGKELKPRSMRWVESGLPEKGDLKWKELTADDVVLRFTVDRMRGESDEVWHSIDTFSGE